MKRNGRIFTGVALIFAAIGMYVGAKSIPLEARPASQAPAVTNLFRLSMADAHGQTTALARWKGKTLLVNFWATWCAPCVQEMPELSALQTEVSQKNIQIIGIGIDSAANIAEFSTRHKISYPLYIAGMNGTDLSREFGNQTGGLPYTVLISSDGQVRKTYLGRLKLQELRSDLLAL